MLFGIGVFFLHICMCFPHSGIWYVACFIMFRETVRQSSCLFFLISKDLTQKSQYILCLCDTEWHTLSHIFSCTLSFVPSISVCMRKRKSVMLWMSFGKQPHYFFTKTTIRFILKYTMRMCCTKMCIHVYKTENTKHCQPPSENNNAKMYGCSGNNDEKHPNANFVLSVLCAGLGWAGVWCSGRFLSTLLYCVLNIVQHLAIHWWKEITTLGLDSALSSANKQIHMQSLHCKLTRTRTYIKKKFNKWTENVSSINGSAIVSWPILVVIFQQFCHVCDYYLSCYYY